MLSVIKNIFVPTKDYAGRSVNAVIARLAAQTNTHVHAWSYLKELEVYENTETGTRVYRHETSQRAA
ncbi:hypothetical protein CW749_17985 [Vibrio sp. vnigr-6D03]|uniref:hypothetical protein n=1 Tax=Vibrio TaxID=662 RepID=UPI000C34EB26|nr:MULTISPECIES: hypothetical protein [Vibrio]MDP2574310.1 hypothetical protein [Vibrio penaeicida]PKF78100.1 hypothetical protein CW749_17985 [Vibrio sp. vnigr-6D03]